MPRINDPGEVKSPRSRPPTQPKQPAAPVAQPGTTPQPGPDPFQRRLDVAQKNSNNLVPVRSVLDLAGLNAADKEIAIASRSMARAWDVSPQALFGEKNPRKVVSQITGQPVSMKEAQRFTNFYSPVAIASMLKNYLPEPAQVIRKQVGDEAGPGPRDIQQWANVIARQFEVPLAEGIAIAAMLAKGGGNPKTFEQNVPMVKAWLTANGRKANFHNVVDWTHRASARGVAHNITELEANLYGKGAVKASAQLKSTISSIDTIQTPQGDVKYTSVYLPGQFFTSRAEAEAAVKKEAVKTASDTSQLDRGIVPTINEYGMLGPDYWQQVNDLANKVELQAEAFHNSFLGKWSGRALGLLNNVYHGTEKAVWDAALTAGSGFRPQTFLDPGEAYQTLVKAHQESWRRIEGGENVGDFTRDGWSDITGVQLPDWTGNALDFLILWELDPFAVGGKALRASRALRLAPELERAGLLRHAAESIPGVGRIARASNEAEVIRATDRFTNTVMETLPNSYRADRAFKALQSSESKYLHEVDTWSHEGAVANRTLDMPYMLDVRDNLLKKFADESGIIPKSRLAAAKAEWQDALRAHFIGWGPEGSVARASSTARAQVRQGAALGARDPLMEEVLARDMSDTLQTAMPELGWHEPFTLEVPSGSRLSILGPRNLTRRAMTGEHFTNTALGRRISALPNINPGREMPLYGPEAADHILADSRRTTVFSEAEARGWQSKVLDVQKSGVRVEPRIEDIRADMEHEFVTRLLKPHGATQQDVIDFEEHVLGPVRDFNRSREDTTGFAALGNEAQDLVTGQPLFPQQLRNSMFTADPIEVRSALRQYLGDFQMMKTHFKNALQIGNATFAKNEHLAHAISGWSAAFSQDILRDFRHIWKALIVARPGYIPRVVLGDENLRFLSVSNSITERVMSQTIWSKLADKTGAFERTWTDVEGQVFHTVKLPGLYENNPIALNNVRGTELREDILRGAMRWDKQYQSAPLSWGNIIHASKTSVPEGTRAIVDEAAQMEAWTWALSKQFGPGPGYVALRSVAEGDDVAKTQAALLKWAEDDHFVTLRSRLGIDPSFTNDWANQVASVVHVYTMDSKQIANLALNGDAKDLRAVLENVPKEKRPPVHGASVDTLTAGVDYAAGTRAINGMYKWIVQKPEAAWNRHPFFKMMKRRADISMYDMVEAAGRKDPSLLRVSGDAPTVEARTVRSLDDMQAVEHTPRANEYWYHLAPSGTKGEVGIRGLRPGPAEGMDAVFLSNHPEGAFNLVPRRTGEYNIYRVKRGDVTAETTGGAIPDLEVTAPGGIPANKLEVWTNDGWKPAERGTGGISDELKTAIDHASTEFAKGQVERVMFDFTKQSRFTELLQFLTPFPQPFFEGFQAWAHLIRRNPATIARAQALYRLGVNTGFIYHDPITDQDTVDFGKLPFVNRLLDAVLPGDTKNLGINFVAPLSNFNYLASQTIKLPSGLPLVGGAGSPSPGLRPEVATVMQAIFRNTTDETLTSLLFQNGPHANFIPRTISTALAALGVKLPEQDSLVLSIMRAYQANHVYFDANGNATIPEADIIKHAEDDAHDLALIRNFMSLISPASLRTQTAATANDQLFQQYIDTSGGDFRKALDSWHKDHPDLWLTPVGKTLYEGFVENPVTGEKFRGPRIPSSQFVMQMLNTKGVGDLMKTDKAWAGLLLIGLPSNVTEAQDFPTFARLLASGDFRYKTPQEFFGDGEEAVVNAKVSDIYTQYDNRLQLLTEKHVSTQDPAYGALRDYLQSQFQVIAREHPSWALTHLDYNDGQYSWPEGGGRPIETVLGQARQIVQMPGFEQFPGVKGLNDYLDLRDKIEAKMKAKGYTDILQGGEGADALAAQYARGVTSINNATEGIGQYLSAMFGVYVDKGTLINTDDLRKLQSSKSSAWQTLRTKNPDLYTSAQNFDIKYNAMSPYYKHYDTKWQRSQDYYQRQQFIDKAYATDPKTVEAWWKTIGKPAQKQHLLDLAYTPAVYYTRWDWHLSGVKLNDEGAAAMQHLAKWWVQYTKLKENDPNFASTDAFNALNASIASYERGAGAKNGFKSAVEKINDWSFPFKAANLAEQPGKLGWAWKQVIDASRAEQGMVVRTGLTGVSGNSDALNQFYADEKQRFLKYVKNDLMSADPAFKKQWYEVQQALGGDPMIGSVILPDTYYGPYGVTNYGKGV